MNQLNLFADMEPAPVLEDLAEDWSAPHGRCGSCRWMDWTLPGCYDGTAPNGSRDKLGRCTNPSSFNYYLAPMWTNAESGAGSPPGGSWRYVASDSAGCDKVARR